MDTFQHIYQVLHLLLHPGHGLLGTNSKDKSVHVVVIERHFDLLRTDGRTDRGRRAEPFKELNHGGIK